MTVRSLALLWARLLSERAGLIAFAICAVYVLALAYPAHLNVVGAFSDFYVRYAPDADLIARGEFPSNDFNPPGYPVLLILLSPLTGDHFTTAKWMSLLAAGLTGWLSFFLFRRLFGAAPALLAIPIILLSKPWNRYSFNAMTDIPFVCVCVVALLVITDERRAGWPSAVLAGVVCSIAYLLRYNALFLLVPGLVAVISREGTLASRARLVGLFLGSFALTAAPWWWVNYTHYGSPFYSRNFEDVALALKLNEAGGRPFTSLLDVVFRNPGRFAWRYIRQVPYILSQSLGSSLALLPVGPLAVLGIVLGLARQRTRPVLLMLVAWLSFLLFMSLTHWEPRYFFFMLVCHSGFAMYALFEIARWVGRTFGSPVAARVVVAVVFLWILIPTIVVTVWVVRVTLGRQPLELLPAARQLASVAPPGATVMSLRAQIAYLSGLKWRGMPGASSIEELKIVLSTNPPDYIVLDRWGKRFAKPLIPLMTQEVYVPWLELVYSEPQGKIVIYAVHLERS